MPSTDYAKLKNAELESLLKERSLPHTGKKAEMVSRLQQDDKKRAGGQESTPAPTQQTKQPMTQQSENTPKASKGVDTTAAEDEIDWDDDDAVAIETEKPEAAAADKGGAESKTSTSAAAAAAATTTSTKGNQLSESKTNGTVPAAEKNDTSPATDAAPTPAEGGETRPAPAPDTFASGLAATTIEEELAKRRARAKKFGLADESEQDAIKALERAKRFGETTAGPRGLNEALPERMAKNHKKRGRGDRGDDDGYDGQRNGGGRRFGGGKGRFRSKGKRNGGGGDSNSKPAWMSAADRERAEARQKRFTAS